MKGWHNRRKDTNGGVGALAVDSLELQTAGPASLLPFFTT